MKLFILMFQVGCNLNYPQFLEVKINKYPKVVKLKNNKNCKT